MKNKILLPTLIGLLLLPLTTFEVFFTKPAVSEENSVWKEFSSNRGRFQILMPGTPQQLQQSMSVRPGLNVMVRGFAVERKKDSTIYFIGYTDYPIGPNIPFFNVNGVFNSGRDKMIEEARGKLLSEKNISLSSYPGREFRYSTNNGKLYKMRMYFVNSRLYVLGVETRQEKQLAKTIDGFLNSFQFLPQ